MYHRKIRSNWIDGFMSLGEGSESPPLYYKWAALVYIACVLKRKVWIQRPHYKDYPNLYVILVSPPGVTRKSTPCDLGYNAIVKNIPSVRKFTGRITTEAICQKLQKLEVQQNSSGCFLIPDSSLFLYASELSSLFQKLPRGSYPVIDFLTAIYGSGGEFTYETKSGGEQKLTNVCINLLAATTVAGVNALIGVDGVEGGFTSRTIFVYQDGRMPKPWPEDDKKHQNTINFLLEDLTHISATIQGEMKVPLASRKWFDNWYIPQALQNPPPELIHYWSRRHDHLLKIAMLYAVADRDELVLRIKDLEKAKETMEEVERFMPYAFLGIDKTKESCTRELILSFIKLNGGEATHSQVLRKFQHRLKTSKELKEIIISLIDSDLLDAVQLLKNRGTKYIIKDNA